MVNPGTGYKRPRPTHVVAPGPAFAAAAGPATAATIAPPAVAADNDSRIQRLHDAVATLSSVGLADTSDVRAINVLNKLTADGELEILLESTAPELLDAIADALDRHNSPMLHVLHTRLAKQKPTSSPASHQPGHENGHGAASSAPQHPVKSKKVTTDQSPHGATARLLPPWLNVSERHITHQDPGPLVLGLLSILRNLSYIVANEESLARHTRILTHLVSLLPCAYQHDNTAPTGGRWPQSNGNKKTTKGSGGEIGTCVVDLLLALSPRLDVAGLTMDEDEQLLAEGVPEDSLMAFAPAKIRAQYIESQHQGPEQQEYIELIQSLLRLLMDLLTYPAAAAATAAAAVGGGGGEDRQGILNCLELLARLMSNHEANAQLVARYASPAFLVRLHEFFYVPLQGLDSMEGSAAAAATFPGGKPRPRYAMKNGGQQQQQEDGSGDGELDVEVRGWSLEVLAALCGTISMEGERGTEGGLREGGKDGGFRDDNNEHKDLVARLLKHVPGLVRSLVLLLDVPTAAQLAGRLSATLARGGAERRAALEGQKRLLTHYAFRPGGDVAVELLWSCFLAPAEEEGEEEDREEEEEEEEEEGMDQ